MDNYITLIVKPVGNNCNLKCIYCDENHTINHSYQQFDFNFYRDTLVNLHDRFSFCNIVIHGGEPLLSNCDDIIRILETGRTIFGNNCTLQLQTNGVLFERELAISLEDIGCKISISFDPAEGDVRYNSDIRKKVLDKIRLLVNLGITPGIISVAHAHNMKSFSEHLKFLINENIHYWTVNKIRAGIDSNLWISEKQYINILESLIEIWIQDKLYSFIEIEPILELLSPGENHNCRFCSIADKCKMFATIENNMIRMGCEHSYNSEFAKSTIRDIKCQNCDAFNFCGCGCPAEIQDNTFCESRKHFMGQIRKLKEELKIKE